MVTGKIIILLTILLLDQCNSEARHVHKVDDELGYEHNKYDPNEYQKYLKLYHSLSSEESEESDSECKTDLPDTSHEVFLETEVVQAGKSKYMVRLFSQCGKINVTKTNCMGVIIGENTVITSAHCVLGQDTFQACTRKKDETTCPVKYDPNDKEHCFETNKIYLHPDFINGLLNGVLCHNIAILKWSTNVFKPDQVHAIDFADCNFVRKESQIATIIQCGNKPNEGMQFFTNQIKSSDVLVDAYGVKYSQCPAVCTEKSELQLDVPCGGSSGSALFILKGGKDGFYNPNIDDPKSAMLYGLGSFTGKDCKVPSVFVSLCEHKLFISNPEAYGVTASSAIETLLDFGLPDQIKVGQTLLLDVGHISCALQLIVRSLTADVRTILETVVRDLFEPLLPLLPN